MQTVRRLVLGHRHWAALLLLVTLALRLVVPAGYMISAGQYGFAVTICAGVITPSAAMPGMPGMEHDGSEGHGGSNEQGQADKPCAFAGLFSPALAGVDAVILALALAIVAAVALFVVPPGTGRRAPYLRPPSRGPPPVLI